ncbi:MAG: ATP-binding protein [Firmicutes bacterium]|nr:ATP-binding protein [Bacillota bacterium]
MAFINRLNELGYLNDKYRARGSQLIVIYGKRRVGKTELAKQFALDKPYIYFMADRASELDQLRQVSERIGDFYRDSFVAERGFVNWHQVFDYLASKRKRLLLIIDEFPYLASANPAVSSVFQKGWDEKLKSTNIYLILMGSSVAMMESEVLATKAPLYGRRTGQLLVEPMRFHHAKEFFPKKSFSEQFEFYSVLGGVPAYLLHFDPKKSLVANIRNHIISKGEVLYEEPEFILKEELREPRSYFSILRAISLGKAKLSEIMNETGFVKNVLIKYLSVLIELGIVVREVPITEKQPAKSKRGIYKITDPFFKFWFEYVFANRSYIEEGRQDYVLGKIRASFNQHVSEVYEQEAAIWLREHLASRHPKLEIIKTGRWWSKSCEIDVVGLNEDNSTAIFAEAKWTSKPVGMNVLEDLLKKVEIFESEQGEAKVKRYALFSQNGFTDSLKKLARERKDVILFEGCKPIS